MHQPPVEQEKSHQTWPETGAGLESGVEPRRLRVLRGGPPRIEGRYVLYWMQINRRATFNPALDHAIATANRLKVPLVVYEAIRADYPFANDRLHTFMLEGALERHQALRERGIRTVFYLQSRPEEHRDTVARLCREACLVITDSYPVFLIRRHNQRLLEQTTLPVIAVDASTVVPPLELDKAEYAARTIRPKLHRLMLSYLHAPPVLELAVPAPRLTLPLEWETDLARPVPALVKGCAIDHSVRPSLIYRGGNGEAGRKLTTFIRERLHRYPKARNNPGERGTSELSAYLHFGMISPIEIALQVMASGEDEGAVLPFLEELIVRRELAFNYCEFNPDYRSLNGLPNWVRKTLGEHAGDPRGTVWNRDEIEAGRTHDPVFNLAQRELRATGEIHGYIRMLWGKKILEYSASHAQALETMIELHDRYALDGRDPNTYANILWCFGLHDRPWGPARPVYGLIRTMSSDRMRQKTDMKAYERWVEECESTVGRP